MSGYSEITWLLLILLGITSVLPFVWQLMRRQQIDVFEPVLSFTGFYFLLFVAQPLMLMSENDPVANMRAFTPTLFYALIGLLAFYAGYYPRIGTMAANMLPCPSRSCSKIRLGLVLMTLGGISLGANFYFYWFVCQGGMTWAIAHPLLVNEDYLKGGNGYLLLAMSLISDAFLLAYSYALLVRKRTAMIWPILLGLVCALAFLPLGGRWLLLWLILIPLIIRHYYLNKRVRLKWIVASTPLVVIVFGILQFYRDLGEFTLHHSDLVDLFRQTLSGDLLTPFNNFVILVQSIRGGRLGFTHGLYYYYLLLAPIPRALWPDKPMISVEGHFTQAVFAINPIGGTTMTMTIPGEFYFNFGVPSLLVGMFLTGLFWRAGYSFLLKNRQNVWVCALYAMIILAGFNAVRTDWTVLLINLGTSVVPVLLMVFFIAGHQRLPGPKPAVRTSARGAFPETVPSTQGSPSIRNAQRGLSFSLRHMVRPHKRRS